MCCIEVISVSICLLRAVTHLLVSCTTHSFPCTTTTLTLRVMTVMISTPRGFHRVFLIGFHLHQTLDALLSNREHRDEDRSSATPRRRITKIQTHDGDRLPRTTQYEINRYPVKPHENFNGVDRMQSLDIHIRIQAIHKSSSLPSTPRTNRSTKCSNSRWQRLQITFPWT